MPKNNEWKSKRVPVETRAAIKLAEGKYKEIARRFNVSHGIVSLIKNNNYDRAPKYGIRGRPPKLTRESVEEIRQASGRCGEIGRRYGVSGTHISRIKRGLVQAFKETSA